MPTSQSDDSSAITTSVDHIPRNQTLQAVLDPFAGSGTSNTLHSAQPAEGSSLEHVRLSLLRTNDALCIILTLGLIVVLPLASTVAFCVTRSFFSLSLLSPIIPGITLLLRLRRRPEEFAFPTSREDQQIRLKELDVEIARIKKQSTITSLPLFSWLGRLLSRWSK